jgi:hypothetical protein
MAARSDSGATDMAWASAFDSRLSDLVTARGGGARLDSGTTAVT